MSASKNPRPKGALSGLGVLGTDDSVMRYPKVQTPSSRPGGAL